MASISTQVVPTITQTEQQDNVIPVYQVSREEMDNQLEVIRETARQNDTSELEEYTRFVVGELSARYPNLLDYDSLKDGTAPVYNAIPDFAVDPGLSRKLDDDILLELFLRDPDGEYIQEGTITKGLKEEILPAVGGFAGAYGGGKLGAALGLKAQAFIPPAGPPAIAAKFLITAGSTIAGMMLGEEGVRTIQRKLFDEPDLIKLGTRPEFEAGRTLAAGLGFLAAPWALSKNINFGATQYLDNVRTLKNQYLEPAEVAIRNYGTGRLDARRYLPEELPPVTTGTRLIGVAEKGLQATARAAREKPKRTLLAEAVPVAGTAVAASEAEKAAPGEPVRRVVYETAGGMGAQAVTQPFVGIALGVGDFLKDPGAGFAALRDAWRQGGIKGLRDKITGKESRREKAARYIVDQLNKEGEDVDQVIAALTQINTLLKDPVSGEIIDLTSASKAGSATLLGIEAALNDLAPTLAKQRIAGSDAAIEALRAQVQLLASTSGGDPVLLQALADQMQIIFEASLSARLNNVTERVTEAFERLGKTGDPDIDALNLSNQELSLALFDIVEQQLQAARATERSLWKQVPSVTVPVENGNIPTFIKNVDGQEVELDFISAWDELLPNTLEAREFYLSKLKPLNDFITRKREEFGVGGADATTPGAVEPSPRLPVAEVELEDINQELTRTIDENPVGAALIEEIRGLLENPAVRITDDPFAFENLDELSQIQQLQSRLAISDRGNPRDRAAAQVILRLQESKLNRQAEIQNLTSPADFSMFDLVDVPSSEGPTLSSRELTEMRSIALNLVRELRAQGSLNSARIAGEFADDLLAQLNEFPDEQLRATYQQARSYSAALNDTFTRAAAGDILQQNRLGTERSPPELLLNRLLRGGADPTLLRIQQIQEVGRFGIDPEFVGPVQMVPTLNEVTEAIIRSARSSQLGPLNEGDKLNVKALNRWIANNKELLDAFPAIRADLENLDSAAVLLTKTEARDKRTQKKLRETISFQDLTSTNARSPAQVVATIFSPATKFPYKALDELVRVVDTAPGAARLPEPDPTTGARIVRAQGSQSDQAAKALQGAIIEWAATMGGITSDGKFKPSEMRRALFTPDAVRYQRRDTRTTPIDYMKANGLITDQEVTNLDRLLNEMIKFEIGTAQGNIERLAAEAGPIYDFFVRVSGATVGTKVSQAVGGANPLIAAESGSKAMRNVAYNLPLAMQMDVMVEFMENPEMLATFLTKVKNKTPAEQEALADKAADFLRKMGINILRRPAPAVSREATEEGLIIEPAVEGIIGREEQEDPVREIRVPAPPPAPSPPIVQSTAPPSPPVAPAPAVAQSNPQSLQRAVQVLGMDDEIGGLASEMLMRQRPS